MANTNDYTSPLLASDGVVPKNSEHKCTSHHHEPGACHGFDVMKAGGQWMVAHGDFNLADAGKDAKELQAIKRKNDLRILGTSALVMAMVMVLEVSSGLFLGSLALLSDGVHYASDVALYAWLLASVVLSGRKADLTTYSFGYHRAEVLGSLMALLLQYFSTGLLVVSATERLTWRPHAVNGFAISAVGVVSLGCNLCLLYCMPQTSSGHGHSHGSGGHSHGSGGAVDVARLHMLGDLVQGSAVILTGIISWIWPACTWADPSSTFVYACVVLGSSWRVFQELVTTLMERAPLELDVKGLYDDMTKLKGVIDVHCCHVWALAPGKVAMSAHLHIEDDKHEDVLHAAQILVKHKYGIAHSTLQVSEDEDLA